jgi:VCBS repeat-containing protein
LLQYQTALAAVKYDNTNDSTPIASTRVISFLVDDGSLVNNLSNIVTQSITVIPVNDAPIAVNDAFSGVPEGGTLAVPAAGVLANDRDPDGPPPLTAQKVTDVQFGTLTLNSDGSFTYLHDGSENFVDGFTYRASDSQLLSNTANVQITVTAINDPPVLGGVSGILNYTEGEAAKVIAGSITVTDPDNTTLTSATVTISGGFVNSEDSLFVSVSPPLTVAPFNGSTGVLTISGPGTKEEYRQALSQVKYVNTNDSFPNTSFRTVSFRVNDGSLLNNFSTNVSKSINITAVNDPPVLGGVSGTLSYTEGEGAKVIASTITVSDADNTTLSGATVTISSGFITAEDSLFATVTAPLSALPFNKSTGVLTISGTGTLLQYRNMLRTVKYLNTNDSTLNTLTRTVSFRVNDGSSANNLSNIVSKNITFITVNNPPVLGGVSGTMTYSEGDAAKVIAATITVADIDNITLSGATITVSSGFISGEDSLLVSVTPPLTATPFNETTGVLAITGTGTLLQYTNALRAVKYINNNDSTPHTANRKISFQVDDGSSQNNLSNIVSKNITVIAVNDPPVATNAAITGSSQFLIGDLLKGTYTYYDPENDPQGNSTFQWLTSSNLTGIPHSPIAGSVKDTFTLRYNNGGNYIAFSVTPYDDLGKSGVSDTSIWRYVNAAPVFTDSTVLNKLHPGSFAVGQIVTGHFPYSDKEGNIKGAHDYQWYRSTGSWTDATIISGATDSTYTIKQADKDKFIAIQARPKALAGSSPGRYYRSTWYSVSLLPSASISKVDSICNNPGSQGALKVALTTLNPPVSFVYQINNNPPVTVSDINDIIQPYSLIVSDTGTYKLLSVSDKKYSFGIRIDTIGRVEYYPKPTANLPLDNMYICSGDITERGIPVVLSGNSPLSIIYRIGFVVKDTITDIMTQQASIIVDGTGIYTISKVTDRNGCTSVGSGQTTVSPKTDPIAAISGIDTVCPGAIATLDVNLSGAGPWKFYFTINNNSDSVLVENVNSGNYQLNTSIIGTYRITHVYDVNNKEGCSSGSGTVSNFPLPTVNISGDEKICEGDSTTFNVQLTGSEPWDISYQIDGGSSAQISGIRSSPYDFWVKKPGKYSVQNVTDKHCTGTSGSLDTASLTVNPLPEVIISGLKTVYLSSVVHVPVTFSPPGGSYKSSDNPNAIQLFSNTLSFWPVVSGLGQNIIRYEYQDPVTQCFGKDSIRINVIEKDGEIQYVDTTLRNSNRRKACSNYGLLEIEGLLSDTNSIGTFSIDGDKKALITEGLPKNTALLVPSEIQTGSRTVSFSFEVGGIPQVNTKIFNFERVTADFKWDNECFNGTGVVNIYDNSKIEPDTSIVNRLWDIHF